MLLFFCEIAGFLGKPLNVLLPEHKFSPSLPVQVSLCVISQRQTVA